MSENTTRDVLLSLVDRLGGESWTCKDSTDEQIADEIYGASLFNEVHSLAGKIPSTIDSIKASRKIFEAIVALMEGQLLYLNKLVNCIIAYELYGLELPSDVNILDASSGGIFATKNKWEGPGIVVDTMYAELSQEQLNRLDVLGKRLNDVGMKVSFVGPSHKLARGISE